jgi:hypothetical protein
MSLYVWKGRTRRIGADMLGEAAEGLDRLLTCVAAPASWRLATGARCVPEADTGFEAFRGY